MQVQRRPVRRLARRELGGGHLRRAQGHRRAEQQGAGELQDGLRVGQAVFDGLEGTDGDAEPGALPHLDDGPVEQGEADTEGLGGGGQAGPGELSSQHP